MNCTSYMVAGTRLGTACHKCGHMVEFHQGVHNPSLNECIMCSLVDLQERLKHHLDSGAKIQ